MRQCCAVMLLGCQKARALLRRKVAQQQRQEALHETVVCLLMLRPTPFLKFKSKWSHLHDFFFFFGTTVFTVSLIHCSLSPFSFSSFVLPTQMTCLLHFHLRPQPFIMRLSLNLYIGTFNYESLPKSIYLNVQLEVGGAMSPILIIKIHSKCRFGPTLPSSYSFLPSRSKYFSFFLTRKFFESKIRIHTHIHTHTVIKLGCFYSESRRGRVRNRSENRVFEMLY
ncbi:MAG: hypothetical protein BYD32DRAFT_250083 [Podila humilis]|nr:MAG: hypothetical protein BYD32DRAFT_250083 [Podila humilis]